MSEKLIFIIAVIVVAVALLGYRLWNREEVMLGSKTSKDSRGAGRAVEVVWDGTCDTVRWMWNHHCTAAGGVLFVALNALFVVFPALWKGLVGQGWVAVLLIELLFAAVAIGSWSGRNAGHITAIVTGIIAGIALMSVAATTGSGTATTPTTAAAPAKEKEWVKELVVPAGETGIVYAREVGEHRGYGAGCSKIVMDDNGREFVLSLPSPNARDNEIPIGDKTIGLEVHTYPGKECVVWRKG